MASSDESLTSSSQMADSSAVSVNEEEAKPSQEIKPCCIQTIKLHARFNPMMVCSECKHIIKCFKDEAAYSKYLLFCDSRKRHVATGDVDDYHTIVFKSYDSFR